MKDNRKLLYKELKVDLENEVEMGNISENREYEILDEYEEWLETANIGDSFYHKYSLYSYKLEELF